MRNGERTTNVTLSVTGTRTRRTLAGVLLVAGLITVWTLTVPAGATAGGGSPGSSRADLGFLHFGAPPASPWPGGRGRWSAAAPACVMRRKHRPLWFWAPGFCLVRQSFVLRGRRLRGPSAHVRRDNLVGPDARRLLLGLLQFRFIRDRLVLRGRRLRGPSVHVRRDDLVAPKLVDSSGLLSSVSSASELRSAWRSTTRAERSRLMGRRGQLRNRRTRSASSSLRFLARRAPSVSP